MSNPKEITIEGALYRLVERDALDEAWEQRRKLYAEGDKLYAEGNKLYAEGNKLYAEGDKLYAEGDIVFFTAVIDTLGPNAKVEWTRSGCTVNGRVFTNA